MPSGPPPLEPTTSGFRKITKNTVIKPTCDAEGDDIYPAEALAQQLILEQTTIPVPQIYRVSQIQGCYFIAMEHIPGEQLLSVWPRLSWPARVPVALTLRSYVLQLRKVRHPERETIPGPLGVPGQRLFEPVVCVRSFSWTIQFVRRIHTVPQPANADFEGTQG